MLALGAGWAVLVGDVGAVVAAAVVVAAGTTDGEGEAAAAGLAAGGAAGTVAVGAGEEPKGSTPQDVAISATTHTHSRRIF